MRRVDLFSRRVAILAAMAISLPTHAAMLEFDEYLQRAEAARARSDWESVANQYAQAINHPDLPKDGVTRSMVNLEYGRALGVICQYEEAEKYLLRAKDIAEKSGAPMFSVLYELGSISVAEKKYANASIYFSGAVPSIDRDARAKNTPLIVADAYEKFALALTALGKADEAAARRADAAKVRETRLRPAPPGTITPYGAQCQK
ncbi:MAG: hypothetical protein ABI905_11635 [Betaproteobacteria bacterium]